MTKSLATEWAPRGLTVNALGPAYTETGLTKDLLADPERRQRITATIPMGRLGTPDDLVGAAVYLCSDAARFVTGQTSTSTAAARLTEVERRKGGKAEGGKAERH